jgi:NAD(P)-dependent dehydrogenase (short-subunit alcohol dehydrogenase family)
VAESAHDRGLVVVTGASTGIGRACALHMSGRGFTVMAGVRKPEDGERLRSEAPGALEPLRIDVTDEAAIAKAGAQVRERAGDRGLAGLVNNAGVGFGGPLEFVPIEDVRDHLEVNLIGHVAVTQQLIEPLRQARGRVVNMSSIGGRVTAPLLGPYGMAKAGMVAFSEALRRELRPWGIWVAVVMPGNIQTPIWDKGEQIADEIEQRLPPAAKRLYGEAMAAARKMAAAQGGRAIPPEKVARVVHQALTARRPRARYLVGPDARAMRALQAALPKRTFDALILRSMGIPRRPPA